MWYGGAFAILFAIGIAIPNNPQQSQLTTQTVAQAPAQVTPTSTPKPTPVSTPTPVPTPTPAQALQEFKMIWRQETGQEITDKEALDAAVALLHLFDVIYRPIPKDWSDEYDNHKQNYGTA
jgi:hypothetical protein